MLLLTRARTNLGVDAWRTRFITRIRAPFEVRHDGRGLGACLIGGAERFAAALAHARAPVVGDGTA